MCLRNRRLFFSSLFDYWVRLPIDAIKTTQLSFNICFLIATEPRFVYLPVLTISTHLVVVLKNQTIIYYYYCFKDLCHLKMYLKSSSEISDFQILNKLNNPKICYDCYPFNLITGWNFPSLGNWILEIWALTTQNIAYNYKQKSQVSLNLSLNLR